MQIKKNVMFLNYKIACDMRIEDKGKKTMLLGQIVANNQLCCITQARSSDSECIVWFDANNAYMTLSVRYEKIHQQTFVFIAFNAAFNGNDFDFIDLM